MSRTSRKCSRCRAAGHTKRTCLTTAESKPKVIVRVIKSASSSPHVVDLRSTETGAALAKTPIFQEPALAVADQPEILDLAELVREANAHQEKFWARRMSAIATRLGDGRRALFHRPILPPVSFDFNFNWRPRRLAAAMAIIALVIGLPFPAVGYYQKLKDVSGVVAQESAAGFLALQASTVAALASNLPQAQQDLNQALQAFAAANSFLEKDYHLLASIIQMLPIVGRELQSRQQLLLAGQHLALGNTYLIKGIAEAEQAKTLPFTDRLAILERHLRSAQPQYSEALNGLNQVRPEALPAEYQQLFADFKLLLAAFTDDLRDLSDLTGMLRSMLGDDSFRRYLVVFQNHHELRPAGGFAGSFALVDIQKGKLLKVEVPAGGSYDLRGQLTEFVKPPLPLQLANARWEFQDANWFPDFPASAAKLAWFYRAARGATVDGVIAINASVLERLLRVTGPVAAADYDLVLAHETALEQLQEEVEFGADKAVNQPKAVIAALLEQLLTLLPQASATDLVRLLTELNEAAEEKEIQIALRDEAAQSTLRQFGWTGEIWPTPAAHDYLLVVHSNIQGQKSDARIEQTIEHQAQVKPDGSIVDTVLIRRAHRGRPGEALYGGPNISYVRVYVPEGAELLDAGGFTYPPEDVFQTPESWYKDDQTLKELEQEVGTDIKTGTRLTKEFGKTVFGNWVITPPGETSEVFFTYRLPFALPIHQAAAGQAQTLSPYRLLLQKQSGVASGFTSRLIYPSGWTPVWRSDPAIDLALNGAVYETALMSDRVMGVVFEHDR